MELQQHSPCSCCSKQISLRAARHFSMHLSARSWQYTANQLPSALRYSRRLCIYTPNFTNAGLDGHTRDVLGLREIELPLLSLLFVSCPAIVSPTTRPPKALVPGTSTLQNWEPWLIFISTTPLKQENATKVELIRNYPESQSNLLQVCQLVAR